MPDRSPAGGLARRVELIPALAVAAAWLAAAGAAEPRLPPGLEGAACVACRVESEDLLRDFAQEDLRAIHGGEVVAREVARAPAGERERTVTAAGFVIGAPEQVWSVLTDWESYPSFFPNAKETHVRRIEGRRAWLSQRLEVFFFDVRYGVVWEMDPEAGRVRFELDPDVPHDIAGTRGSWRLAPLDAGARTLVRYEAWIDTGRAVPGFVEEALMRRSLPRLLVALREEVGRRFGRPGGAR